jgi:hypothetical protein
MSWVEALAGHLATNGRGTSGTDLFVSMMPDKPDVCRALIEGEGTGPVEVMSPGIAVETPTLQVLVRAGRDDYPAARDEALAIRAVLLAITDQTIAGVRFLRVRPSGYINPLGKDDDDRPIVSANFTVQFA